MGLTVADRGGNAAAIRTAELTTRAGGAALARIVVRHRWPVTLELYLHSTAALNGFAGVLAGAITRDPRHSLPALHTCQQHPLADAATVDLLPLSAVLPASV